MEEIYDAIVVGSGPGGASAAVHLARSGASVLVLDKRRFPREKACGDYVSGEAVAELGRIGPPVPCSAGRLADRLLVRSVGSAGCHEHMVALNGDRCAGRVIGRMQFDWSLRQAAVAQGARVKDGVGVAGVEIVDGHFGGVWLAQPGHDPVLARGRHLVLAEGALAPIATSLGVVDPLSVLGYAIRAYYAGVQGKDHLVVYYPLPGLPAGMDAHGYGWVFPSDQGDIVNIGVGLYPTGAGSGQKQLVPALHAFVEHLRSHDDGFSEASPAGRHLAAALRTGLPDVDQAVPAGVLPVGDTAGLVDPLTGEGIAGALESGRLAAEALLAAGHDATETWKGYVRALHQRHALRFDANGQIASGRWDGTRILDTALRSSHVLFRAARDGVFHLGRPDQSGPARAAVTDQYLDAVNDLEELVSRSVSAILPMLFPVIRSLLRTGDATLRAILLLATSDYSGAGSRGRRRRLRLAAGLELARIAVVLHDDADTLEWQSWDLDVNNLSLMAGDVLLARSYAAVASVGVRQSTLVSRRIREVWGGLLGGAVADDPLHRRPPITFYELACTLGSMTAGGGTDAVVRASVAGRAIGGRRLAQPAGDTGPGDDRRRQITEALDLLDAQGGR